MTCMQRALAVFALSLFVAVPAFADTGILEWTANTEDDLAGYKIYIGTAPGVYSTIPTATLGKVTTYSMNLPALTEDVLYYATATAFDFTGNESPKSKEVTKLALVPPVPPVLTAVALSPTSAIVSWPTVFDVKGVPTLIDIRYALSPINWGSASSSACTSSPCTIVGLTPGTSYQVQGVVWRVNATGGKVFSGIGAAATVWTPQIDLAPNAPVGVTIR